MTSPSNNAPHSHRLRRLAWWLAATIGPAVAIGAGLLASRALTAPALRKRLPPLPDLSSAPSALRRQLAEADAEARRRVHSPTAVGHLGIVYHANMFYSQAAACYRLAGAQDRRNPDWPYYLSLVHETLGQDAQALAALQTVVRLQPEDEMAWLRLASAALKLNDLQTAEETFQRLCSSPSVGYHAVEGLAQTAARRRDWQRVVEILEPLWRRGELQGAGKRFLAAACRELGRTDDAERLVPAGVKQPSTPPPDDPRRRALEDMSSTSSFLLKCATDAESRLDVARQGALLRRAVAVDPEDYEANMALAVWEGLAAGFQRAVGDETRKRQLLEQSLAHARHAVELRPQQALPYVHEGGALIELGRVDEAVEVLTRAVELNPGFAEAHRNLGAALAARGEIDRALEHARQAVSLSPKDPKMWNTLGVIQARNKEPEEALSSWQRAVDLDPEVTDARANIARTLIRIGLPREALPHLDVILSQRPNDRDARELLAIARRRIAGTPSSPVAP